MSEELFVGRLTSLKLYRENNLKEHVFFLLEIVKTYLCNRNEQ